jgi:hypothetical protein
MNETQPLFDLLKWLREGADSAYAAYIEEHKATACLGADFKLEKGLFGGDELKAHCDAAEQYGRHKALAEAARKLAGIIEP